VTFLSIRPARSDERAELEELQRRASLEVEEDREQLLAHPEEISLPAEQIERGDVLVGEIDGAIAGFAVLIEQDGLAELDGLFVDPNQWKRGIGRALVDSAVHHARRRGLTMITLVANPAARGFYEKCGFSVEGEVQTRFGPALRMSR
jgi:ribosomal protein S18 acetylase RimI-like enzyme